MSGTIPIAPPASPPEQTTVRETTAAVPADAGPKRTLSSFSLEGKVCLITGGAGGLGWAISQALAASGADIAIIDLNVEEAERQAALLESSLQHPNPQFKQIKVTAHRADVSSPDSVEEAVADVIRQHGKIDVLVAAAGFTENFPAVSYPYDRMQKLWGVNVDGTYLFACAIARHLMQREPAGGGSMVFIGSMSGAIVNLPQPQTPYNASKAAVRHMAASLAVEWAKSGIRVNCISPGYMLTPLTRKIFEDDAELEKRWTGMIPQGRMGNPEDVVGAVVFLASDASRYVTGADLRVDGGYTVI